jgi:cell filamentation protein
MIGPDYEDGWDGDYCWPGTSVLRNNLGIRDEQELAEAERSLSSLRILEIMKNPVRGRFDLRHLQDIHHAMFEKIYPWAGKLRTVNISKGNTFCLCQHLETYAEGVFSRLRDERLPALTDPERAPRRLAFFLGEINMLHPFREGNGRAQRAFIEYLARRSGFHAEFSDVSDMEMAEACAGFFVGDHSAMESMFVRITKPIPDEERDWFRRMLAPAGRRTRRGA